MDSTFFVFGGNEPPKTIINSHLLSAYETAEEHLERAITEASFSDLESAIVRGIAAIESFLSGQIGIWNRAHPGEKIIDSRDTKVSFDDKIDKWIPKMTGGSKLNKGKTLGSLQEA